MTGENKQVDETFMTKEELAKRWKTTMRSIEQWVADGKIPKPVKLSPKCVRWRLMDIVEHENKSAIAENQLK